MNKIVLIFLLFILTLSGCTYLNYSQTNSTDTITKLNNPYFFNNNITEVKYSGTFMFDEKITEDVKLYVNEVAKLKNGNVYELKLDAQTDIPPDRLYLGYFYVMEDKIYKIGQTGVNIDELMTSENFLKDSVIVCQENEIKDSLGENEPGWHHYLLVNEDKRQYHSYNNQVETGYYESFTWEKSKGLVYYRSGYGALREAIQLMLRLQPDSKLELLVRLGM